MSLTTKGSRTIELGGESFYWQIRKKPTYSGGLGADLTFAVQLKDTNNAVLLVSCHGPRPDAWIKERQEVVITPSHVRAAIKQAIASGWSYHEEGGAFSVEYEIT